MLLGLIRDGLVSQLSHAGYLGEELAKAQVALQFGFRYDQDRLLRPKDVTTSNPAEVSLEQPKPQSSSVPPVGRAESKMPAVPLTLSQFAALAVGAKADFSLTVEKLVGERNLDGTFLEMDEAQPFTAYHRTKQPIKVSWRQTSKMIMGLESEIQTGSLIRVYGTITNRNVIDADQIIILTKVARVLA